MKKLQSICYIFLLVNLSLQSQILSSTKDVHPVTDSSKIICLNGNWKFHFIDNDSIPDEYKQFYQTSYNDATWGTIPVPGCWETNGIVNPTYSEVGGYNGLYRSVMNVPSDWVNSNVIIRFEGVAYGYEVYVNGQYAGKWESAYNPCQFDITPFISYGTENLLAVRVYTHPKGYQFDENDDWALSGIHRSVTIFPVPDVHIKDLTVTTDFPSDHSSSTIQIAVALKSFSNTAFSGYNLIGKLKSPSGNEIESANILLDTAQSSAIFNFTVSNPSLWTAETPSLYKFDMYLCHDNDSLQYFKQNIGIRKISISGSSLMINDIAVKLRGVCLHETHPYLGRAISHEVRMFDLELMKKAGVNAIRTSHYPPNEDLMHICDSMGFYVMDEVPFGGGDILLNDYSYLSVLETRANATIKRDKNHPSVIIWSLGNENPMTLITSATGQYVKGMDHTRPICYPQYGGSKESSLPGFVDIFSTHYELQSNLYNILASCTHPYIATEYAHSLGLAFEGQEDRWSLLENSPRSAGGFVWGWVDQALRRTGTYPGEEGKTQTMWTSPTVYLDTYFDNGPDGIIYADRNLQVDYWELRKNYSQVVIPENKIEVSQGLQTVAFTLNNKYDFVNLNYQLNCNWFLTENKDTITTGSFVPECPAHNQQEKTLDLTLPNSPNDNTYLLHFDFIDSTGRNLYNKVIRLLPSSGFVNYLGSLTDIEPGKSINVNNGDTIQSIIGHCKFSYNTKDGNIKLKDTISGFSPIETGPFLKVGRKRTMGEERNVRNTFLRFLLTNPLITTLEQPNNLLTISNGYEYTSDEGKFQGIINYEPSDSGWIKVDFNLAATISSSKALLDGGFAMLLDKKITEFRWVGLGPFPAYPHKSTLDEYGIWHVTASDINFMGNRMDVKLALLTDTLGNGLLIIADSCNIDVDKTTSGIVLSYNALVSGRGTKLDRSLSIFYAQPQNKISGSFRMIPVRGDNWPQLLSSLFGSADAQVSPYKPFVAGYDYYISTLDTLKGTNLDCKQQISANSYRYPDFPNNAMDNNLSTIWSTGINGNQILFNFCDTLNLAAVDISFHSGNIRNYEFSMEVSLDNINWVSVLTNVQSSGTTDDYETFSFDNIMARNVRITGQGNNQNDTFNIAEIKFVDINTSLHKIFDSEQSNNILNVYPNPFNSNVTIEFTLKNNDNCKLAIYDMNLKKVKNILNSPLNKGFHSIKVNTELLASGVYFVQLVTDEQSYIRQIIAMPNK